MSEHVALHWHLRQYLFYPPNLFFFRSEAVPPAVVATDTTPAEKYPKLTLHLYEHCPFCVRVQLTLGWKGIPYETKAYGYGANAFLQVVYVSVP